MRFGGLDWDSGNLPKCLSHGVTLGEIEALFADDVYIVRDTIVGGERRTLGFRKRGRPLDLLCLHLARGPYSPG